MSDKNISAEERIEQKEALDKSSVINRSLGLVFASFLIYVAITVAGTSHVDLLLPDSTVVLPLLSVEIPLLGFYIVIPILVLALHFNLLFNLYLHAQKLISWMEVKGTDHKELPAFLFNSYYRYPWSSANGFLVKLVTWLVSYVMPLTVLVFVSSRFLPYHSYNITSWHNIIISIDAFLLLNYWRPINTGSTNEEAFWLGWKDWKFWLKPTKRKLNLLVVLLLIGTTWHIFWIPGDNGEMLFGIRKFKALPYPESSLVVREKNLYSISELEKLKASLYEKVTNEHGWIRIINGLDLRDRDLRFGDFTRSKLYNARLDSANLKGANLKNVYLQGAILDGTDLQGANLMRANLNAVKLWDAKLQGANLSHAQLQGANLLNAQLQGANLERARLQGAALGNANLQGALLGWAAFGCNGIQGTNFDSLYYGKIKYFSQFDTKQLYSLAILIPDSFERSVYVWRINVAIQRCNNFDKLSFDSLLQQNNDRDNCFAYRLKLACESIYIAEGLLQQNWENFHYTDRDSILKYIYEHNNPLYDKLIERDVYKKVKEDIINYRSSWPE